MTLHTVALMIFSVALMLNAAVMIRQYRMLRVFVITLQGFVEQQRLFNEAMEIIRKPDDRSSSIAPE